jgi:TonB family protein
MNTLLNYLIEANACALVILLLYWFILKNETHFAFRRYYLIAGLLLSIVLPLISIPGNTYIPSISQVVPSYMLPEITVVGAEEIQTAEPSLNGWTIAFYFYITGVTIFLIKLMRELYSLCKLIQTQHNDSTIISIESNMVAFSFFQYIFIGNADTLTPTDKENILKHERVHQQLGHSYDILFIELIRIAFWFNPLLGLYKKELCSVHEFQADQKATEGNDLQPYCNLLARVALMSADMKLANHFNNSLTLKRITMMNTVKKKMHWWKAAIMLPLIAGLFFLISCQDQIMEEIKDASKTSSIAAVIPAKVQARVQELQQQNPNAKYEVYHYDGDQSKLAQLESYKLKSIELIKVPEKNGTSQSYLILEKNEQTNQLADVTKTDDEIFLVVEESASPVGGMEAYAAKIYSLLKYPQEARAKGIEGKVFVEFVVELDGTISNLKVLKGIGAGCDEEAMRALQEAGLWNPAKQRGVAVKQRMVMPINFSTGNSNSTQKTSGLMTSPKEMSIEYQVSSEDDKRKVLIGKVKSPEGAPLQGVNLVISNTTMGTVSGNDGSFKLTLPAASGEVWVSYVSYKTTKIKF